MKSHRGGWRYGDSAGRSIAHPCGQNRVLVTENDRLFGEHTTSGSEVGKPVRSIFHWLSCGENLNQITQ